MQLPSLAVIGLVLVAGTAVAQTPMSPEERQYRQCIALARAKPSDGYEAALQWRDHGGGTYARHCAALALVNLKQYAVAADRLDYLAEEAQVSLPRLAPDLYGQAGNAWILADEPKRAVASLDAGLKLSPNNVDLLIDRARAKAQIGDLEAAKRDLDQALKKEPERDDALSFRASARRELGDAPGAMADANAALKINSKNLEALLERGLLKQAAGDKVGAREDWVRLIQLAPGSPAADAAQAEIERLDLKN